MEQFTNTDDEFEGEEPEMDELPFGPGPEGDPDEEMSGNLELLLDIPLSVHVRLGETRLPLGEVLKLGPGSILRLNRSESDGVELFVNGKMIAKGQIIETPEGNIGVEISSIINRAERLRSLE